MGFLRENLIPMKQTLVPYRPSLWNPAFPVQYSYMLGMNFSLHTSQAKIGKLRRRGTARTLKRVLPRVHRALDEAWGATAIFHLKSSQRLEGKGSWTAVPCLASVWKGKKPNPGPWKLTNESSFSLLFFKLTANQSHTHPSLVLPHSFPPRGDVEPAWCRVSFSCLPSVTGGVQGQF